MEDAYYRGIAEAEQFGNDDLFRQEERVDYLKRATEECKAGGTWQTALVFALIDIAASLRKVNETLANGDLHVRSMG